MKGFLPMSRPSLTLLLMSDLAWAQATAQLNGRVSDESGAVLPGVTVTATQTDTGFTRTVVTDETGAWVMPNLPIGPYRLEMSLQGFRTYVQTGIVLQVNANPVINASLALGTLAETVTVAGGGAAGRRAQLRHQGGRRAGADRGAPAAGRQVTDLIVLAGGAVNTGRISALSTSNSVAISVAGGLRNGVEYQLDGAAHNSPHDLGNLPFPFPDALQEFSVANGGLAASTGMHSSAAVNAVTKSGTNGFRGNGFEFFRDSRFNATSPFRPHGTGRQAVGRRAQQEPVRRDAGRSDRAGQALLLRRLRAQPHPSDDAHELRVRAHARDDGGRLHRLCLRRVQRGRTGHAAAAVREQPDRSPRCSVRKR